MSINIKPDEMKLHRSISSMFHLSDDGSTHYLLAFGVLDLGTSFSPPSVRGYVFCQNEPDYITCPFILNRTTDADFIVGAIKVFNDQAYFHGVHAGLVKDFKGGGRKCALHALDEHSVFQRHRPGGERAEGHGDSEAAD